MSIKVKCGGCAKVYSLKDNLAGKKIRCPACKGVMAVPAAKGSPAAKVPVRKPAPAGGGGTVKKPRRSLAASMRPPGKRYGGNNDPDETSLALPPVGTRIQAPGHAAKATAVCKSCGQAVSAKAVSCPHCNHNLRLRRKLSLAAAIESAGRDPGVRADGTRFETYKDKAQSRAEKGLKIQQGIWVVVVLVIAFCGIVTWVIMHGSYWGDSLDKLRADGQIKPPSSSPSSFHPYNAGLKVNLKIPLQEIQIVQPKFPDGGSSTKIASSAFAQACTLPGAAAGSDRRGNLSYMVLGSPALRVQYEIEKLGGTFSPDALAGGIKVPGGKLAIWRQAASLDQQGALSGALLDFGPAYETWIENLEEEMRKAKKRGRARRLELQGTLSFIASHRSCLKGGTGSYADALHEGLTRVPSPASTAGEPPPGSDAHYYHPVIIVDPGSITFTTGK